MVCTMVDKKNAVRNPGYGDRFGMACDQNPHCPDLHKGRYEWIVREFARRWKTSITTESVRRWHSGLARPRQDKNAMLAELLGVDPTWLFMGVDPDLQPREKKARNAMASGVVNVVAGLIQMDGGSPAFPDEDDERAQRENIDIYAIIKGAQYSLHVTLGQRDGDEYRFVVPTAHEGVLVLGVIRDGMNFTICELPEQAIEAGTQRGGSVEVMMSEITPIAAFDRRL